MYKKAICLLLAGNLMVILGLFWAGAVSDAKTASEPVSQLRLLTVSGKEAGQDLSLEELEEKSGRDLSREELEEKSGRDLSLEELEEKSGRDLSREELEGKSGRDLSREELEEKSGRDLSLEELEERSEQSITMGLGAADVAVSGQRIVDYQLVEKTDELILSEEDLETLLRIVEAEAGCEDEDGRLLVANVVLNRVNSESFPETVTEVVFQCEHGVNQFSPVANGRYYTIEISDLTVSAVGRALAGEDISEGALFFASRKHANSDKMRWFDEHLTFLFQHGGHEFFK